MCADYMDKMRGQAQAELDSVKHLKKELAAIEATIQEYEEKIERAEEAGEETEGLREMLEHLKKEREELKKKLKDKKRSGESDEDDEDDSDDNQKKKSKRKGKSGRLPRRKPFYRKKRRRGGGRISVEHLKRIQHTINPFVSRSLKTKIPESSASKHPGLGLGPRSILNRIQFGRLEETEDEAREGEEPFPAGEPWNQLEEELLKAQNRGEVGWEEGRFTPMDVHSRLHTPIDGIVPYDALLMTWEDRVQERFPSEERNRWSTEDYWGRFYQWVDRLAYSQIEEIVHGWASDRDVRNLETKGSLGGPELAFGTSRDNLTGAGDLPGAPIRPEQNPLGPPEKPLNPYYKGLENPLQRDNPLNPNRVEDQR